VAAIGIVWAFASTPHAIQGPYRIGWENAPPEQFRGVDGQPTGAVVELIREAARRRGINLQWVESNESSEAALRSGKVDLWPLMTITPKRKEYLHFSAPYLDTLLSFLILPGGQFQTLDSLSRQSIGIVRLPVNRSLVKRLLPASKLVEMNSPRDLLNSLCNHEVDAAFVDQDQIVHELMRGGNACKDRGFAVIPAPGPRVNLGVGSTMNAAEAADAIRDEIDSLFVEGAVDRIFAHWGYLSGRNAGSVELLLDSRRRERFTRVIAAMFALLLLLALWQGFRFQRHTQRTRKAEAAQTQGYAELLETQRLASLGAWTWDISSGRVRWSEELYRLAGLDPSQPAPDYDGQVRVYTPESFQRLRSAVENARNTGAPFQLELEMTSADSTRRAVTARGEAIFGKNKRIVTLRGTVQDITERKRMQEVLAATESRLQMALDAAKLGTFEWDIPTGNLNWDRHTESIFGFESGAFDRKYSTFEETIHPDDLANLRQAVELACSSHSVYSHEFRIFWPDRSQHWILGLGSFTYSDGHTPARMNGVALDITERRQLEAQLSQAQKMESVGRLAGGIAHDFNNLLTVINGYCELILSELPAGHAIGDQVEQIHRAGNRAAALTQQLLAFSRKQPAQPRLLDLNALVSESKDILQRLVGSDVCLKTGLAPSACSILADSGHIHQILMNLAVNARDAMPSGGELRIETSILEADDWLPKSRNGRLFEGQSISTSIRELRPSDARKIAPGSYVLLKVSDTGTGMDEETQRLVFEPFFTTKPQGKGTGLGLATVYGIVKQNKGWIDIASQPGLGTDFHIFLPLAFSDAGDSNGDPGESPKTAFDARGQAETVLVVEDQDGLLELISSALAQAGYHVLPAANGESALSFAAHHKGPIHLVLADVVMPGISASAMIADLKRARPDIRAVLMSGYSREIISHRGLIKPDDIYISKPFTTAALISRLREVLEPVESGCD
jgi:signal transduction histidine kinase/ABC-type amino acid transport substrate-binding protein/CheY-like chemotaxis protein